MITAQMETATPDQHPAYNLAAKGATAKPELAERMQKAAAIVEANGVTLTSEDTARVESNGRIYAVVGSSCACPDHKLRAPDGWCKHRLAVRMTRALGKPAAVHIDSETAVMSDAQVRTRKHKAQAARNAQFAQMRHEDEESFKKWCNTSAEAGRRYVITAAANGRIAATYDSRLHAKQVQARKYQDSPELAEAKEYWLEKTRQLFAGGN